jgi:hypothetical protein
MSLIHADSILIKCLYLPRRINPNSAQMNFGEVVRKHSICIMSLEFKNLLYSDYLCAKEY